MFFNLDEIHSQKRQKDEDKYKLTYNDFEQCDTTLPVFDR